MKLFNKLIVVVISAVLAACGGGGGSPGTISGGGSSSGGSTTPVAKSSVGLVIVNQAGVSVQRISVGGLFFARAIVKDSLGNPIKGRLVTFGLGSNSIASLDPETDVTDESGVAEVAISPASLASKGAASLLASSADNNGELLQATYDFAISAANLTLSGILVGNNALSSGGNTAVQVAALIDGAQATGLPINVVYKASCGRINGSATDDGVVVTTDGGGVASAVYSSITSTGDLCQGPITISATSAGAVSGQSTVVSVAAPVANAVTFISASPAQIFLKGTGAVDQAAVTFRVTASGAPLQNIPVVLSIETNPGGVLLGSSTATTDDKGNVIATVFSGTRPGSVKVRAALVSNASIFAESQNLTVASGVPSQKFISLSLKTFNPEGADIDGVVVPVTVRVADRLGNAVDDGTVVNFTAEGGQIGRSCATARVDNISSCSVVFTTQNFRPDNLRVSILAFAEGAKDFLDIVEDNFYDPASDSLKPLGDAFRDDNENGVFDIGEFVLPRGGTESCAGNALDPRRYPSRAQTCDGKLSTTVREQAVIMLSSSSPTATFTVNYTGLIPARVDLEVGSEGNPLLPMPQGTTISATAVDNTEENGVGCTVSFGPTGSPIPNIRPGTNPLAKLSTSHSVGLSGCRSGDAVFIDIKAPSGLTTTIPVPL